MEEFNVFRRIIMFSAMILASILPISGQITTSCTNSMISSFTPCLSYVTGSSSNGSSPTYACCNSLSSLAGNGAGCLCLLLTANVPFQLPINRTLALSLPRACNLPSVPLFQCKGSVAPLPAPGPVAFGPGLPPRGSSAAPDTATDSPAPATEPKIASPPVEAISPPSGGAASPVSNPLIPAAGGGLRPQLTPNSATKLSQIYAPSLLLLGLGIVLH